MLNSALKTFSAKTDRNDKRIASRETSYDTMSTSENGDMELCRDSLDEASSLLINDWYEGKNLEKIDKCFCTRIVLFVLLSIAITHMIPSLFTPKSSLHPSIEVPSVPPIVHPKKEGSCPLTFARSPKLHDQMIFRGDSSRKDFGVRKDENLVLCESFDTSDSLREDVWLPDKTLFGEGNGGFVYYTPENVVVKDETLNIFPGLFADLPPIETKVGTVPAKDLMTGHCTPFPECATLDITDEHCTIDGFAGCKRIGTPLVTLNPVTSGRITTRDSFHMTYGRLEARIKLPAGDWLWPAFWMEPVNSSFYHQWPDSGEIDIMESKGNDPKLYGATGGGRNLYSSCLHYAGNTWWKTKSMLSASDILDVCRNGTVSIQDCDWSLDFFTIGLYWSPERMYSYAVREANIAGNIIQDEVIIWDVNASAGFGPYDYPMGSKIPPFYNEISENTLSDNPDVYSAISPNKNAPFDQPFYIILNLSIGGEINGCPNPGYWGPDAIWCKNQDASNPQAARTAFWNAKDVWYPTWEKARNEGRGAYEIDWIKVWQ